MVKNQIKCLGLAFSVLGGCSATLEPTQPPPVLATVNSSPAPSSSPPQPVRTLPEVPLVPTSTLPTPSPNIKPDTYATGKIYGQVTTYEKQPLAGLTVQAESLNGFFPYKQIIQTDAEGHYTFYPPIGPLIEVQILPSGLFGGQTFRVTPLDNQPQHQHNVQHEPIGEVRGHIEDSMGKFPKKVWLRSEDPLWAYEEECIVSETGWYDFQKVPLIKLRLEVPCTNKTQSFAFQPKETARDISLLLTAMEVQQNNQCSSILPSKKLLNQYDGWRDHGLVEKTTFNGSVFDTTNAPLDGVKVTAKSLNASVAFTAETTSTGGAYAFNNAPPGVQVEITATKPGFTTRRRIEVLKSNKQGDPNANKYDFGTDGTKSSSGSINNALTDQPEVVFVSPGRNASGVNPNTSVFMRFSEPMDRSSVENALVVQAYNSRKLTVDKGNTSNTFSGDSQISTFTSQQVWDKNAYNISWNTDDTEVTFAFKPDLLLPSDKDTDKIPDYQILFGANNREIKDKAGVIRTHQHFKLTDGPFEETFKFAIKADEVRPSAEQLKFVSHSTGDELWLTFSEAMLIPTLTVNVAAGMAERFTSIPLSVPERFLSAPAEYPENQGSVTASNTAQNYGVKILRTGQTTPVFNDTLKALGGSVTYVPGQYRQVVLKLPLSARNLYQSQDRLQITVANTVMDPAGNTLNQNKSFVETSVW